MGAYTTDTHLVDEETNSSTHQCVHFSFHVCYDGRLANVWIFSMRIHTYINMMLYKKDTLCFGISFPELWIYRTIQRTIFFAIYSPPTNTNKKYRLDCLSCHLGLHPLSCRLWLGSYKHLLVSHVS
jgi:hypothetical protein